jgi:predicted transglutaminase-like cysteine proteinase
MGKARIVSNLGQAAYSVEILKDVSRVEAARQRCRDGYLRASTEQDEAEQAEADATSALQAASDAVTAQIVAANGDASYAPLLAAQDALNAAAWTLEDAQHAVAQAKLKKLAFDKELATYEGVAGEEAREVWCTDATEDLQAGAEVGTIEINQEAGQILIAPGGTEAEGELQPGIANDALATYLNWAILPGVQKWRPTYRVGTIVEIDYGADTCTVCLDGAHSSAQNIGINIDGAVCESSKQGPQGFVDFCSRNPGHPACTAQTDTTVPVTDDLRQLLNDVNKSVNNGNTYAYDSAQYGRLEFWEEMPADGGGSGDCEDFALTKFNALVAAGVPAGAIKLATGKVASGDGHAWLEVQTDQGNVALDLNFSTVQDSSDLPYSERSVQSSGTSWASKGLLLFDVPMHYMECNSGAFEENDRVVVHFQDGDWSRPEVIGFEEEPESCGFYVIYQDGDKFFTQSISIKNGTIKVEGTPKEGGGRFSNIKGSVPFYMRRTHMNAFTSDDGISKETREVIILGSPFILSKFNKKISYQYYKDPNSWPSDDYNFHYYVIDLKTKSYDYILGTQTQPGYSCFGADGEAGFTSMHVLSFNVDNLFFAQVSTAGPAYGVGYYLTIVDDKISVNLKKSLTIETGFSHTETIALDSHGYVYYISGNQVRKTSILSGATTPIESFTPGHWVLNIPEPAFVVQEESENSQFTCGIVYKKALRNTVVEHGGYEDNWLLYGNTEIIQTRWVISTDDSGEWLQIGNGWLNDKLASFPATKPGGKPIMSFKAQLFPDTLEMYLSSALNLKVAATVTPMESRNSQGGYMHGLTDIKTRDGNTIKAISYINYNNKVATTKDTHVLLNEQDITTNLTNSLGITRDKLRGIIYASGL